MRIGSAILSSTPVSYWPLDDNSFATTVRDEMGLHAGTISDSGVSLAVVPFGAALMPFFDGDVGSLIAVPDDDRYSHTHANLITVAGWICPLALNFRHTDGSNPQEQYVHFIEKGIRYNQDVEWAMRLYNADSCRPSRLSFYLFNSGTPAGKGAGAYMQYGRSANDQTPIEVGRWVFIVGQGEEWIDETSELTGAVLHKQGGRAVRSSGDKYNNPSQWNVRPHNGNGEISIGGSIDKTAFRGSIAHVALWNRLLTANEIEQIWSAGLAKLQLTPMYRRY